MNTEDVERRLEALAAGSAKPELPHEVLDRLAVLQVDAPSAFAPVDLEAAPRLHRVRVAGGPRARGVALLGLAAVLALLGGMVYVAAGRPNPTSPEATSTSSLSQAPTSLPTDMVSEPTAPYSLGPWRQAYTFTGQWSFGHIWGGGPYQPVWLSWQNGEIVGLAKRYSGDQEETCVLQSKDGTAWTCSQLPTPTGEACGPGPCPEATGLAVHNGHWVAVGYTDFRSPSADSGPMSSYTFLTWTSTDGTTWTEQPSARSAPTFVPPLTVGGGPTAPTLLPTGSGFLMARCSSTDQRGLWTSTDGTSWQPATFAPGSQTMKCGISLGGNLTAGYAAIGYCPKGTMPGHDCVAFSADGTTWTTTDPGAATVPELSGQLRILPSPGPTLVDGRWIVVLDNAGGAGGGAMDNYYEASSPDWRLQPIGVPDLLSTEPGLNESDYHPAVFSQLAAAGYWGVNNGPRAIFSYATPSPGYSLVPAAPSTYWSATGMHWQRVSDAPPGWPVDVVETPTGLVVFMGDYPNGDRTPVTTVWVAARK